MCSRYRPINTEVKHHITLALLAPAALPRRLRQAYTARGWTMAECARQAAIPHSAMVRYVTGSHLPSVATLLSLAKALSVSVDWLLGHEGDALPPDAPVGLGPKSKRRNAGAPDGTEPE